MSFAGLGHCPRAASYSGTNPQPPVQGTHEHPFVLLAKVGPGAEEVASPNSTRFHGRRASHQRKRGNGTVANRASMSKKATNSSRRASRTKAVLPTVTAEKVIEDKARTIFNEAVSP